MKSIANEQALMIRLVSPIEFSLETPDILGLNAFACDAEDTRKK